MSAGFITGMLDAAHCGFIETFKSLPRDAQCLYVRMTNRRGDIFPLSSLVYGEIAEYADRGRPSLPSRHGTDHLRGGSPRNALHLA